MIGVPDLIFLQSVGLGAATPASEDLCRSIISYLAEPELCKKLDHKVLLQIFKCLGSWSRTAFLEKLLECGMEHALARTYDILLSKDYSKVETSTSVRELLSLILDISKILAGNEVFGEHIIPRVLALAPLKFNSVELQRVATGALCALITKSLRNQQAFLRSTPDCHKLFRLVLPRCGDFQVQATVSEILYRMLKNGSKLLHLIQSTAARAAMSTLLELHTPNLPAEIRSFVGKVNDSLGPSRRVYSFLADKVTTNGHHIQSEQTWIDFGAHNITICTLLGDDAAWLVDIPYSKVSKINRASEAYIEIAVDTSTDDLGFPKPVQNSDDSSTSVVIIYLKLQDLLTISDVIIPMVAQQTRHLQQTGREGRTVGWKLPLASVAVQPPRKVSAGISIPLPRRATSGVRPVPEPGRPRPATVGSRILAVLLASRACGSNQGRLNRGRVEQCNDTTRNLFGEIGLTSDGQQDTRKLPRQPGGSIYVHTPSSESAISSGEDVEPPAGHEAQVCDQHGVTQPELIGNTQIASPRGLAAPDGPNNDVQNNSSPTLLGHLPPGTAGNGSRFTGNRHQGEAETGNMDGVSTGHVSGSHTAFCVEGQRGDYAESVKSDLRATEEIDLDIATNTACAKARSGVRRTGEPSRELPCPSEMSVRRTRESRSRITTPRAAQCVTGQYQEASPKKTGVGTPDQPSQCNQFQPTEKATVLLHVSGANLGGLEEADDAVGHLEGNLSCDSPIAPLPVNRKRANESKPRQRKALQKSKTTRSRGAADMTNNIRGQDRRAIRRTSRHKKATTVEADLNTEGHLSAQGCELLRGGEGCASRCGKRRRTTEPGATKCTNVREGTSSEHHSREEDELDNVELDTSWSSEIAKAGVTAVTERPKRRLRRRAVQGQNANNGNHLSTDAKTAINSAPLQNFQVSDAQDADDQDIMNSNASERNTAAIKDDSAHSTSECAHSSPLNPPTEHFRSLPRIRRRWERTALSPQRCSDLHSRDEEPTESESEEATAGSSENVIELDPGIGEFGIVARMLESFKTKNKLLKHKQIAKILSELTSKVQLDIEVLDSSFKNGNEELRKFCEQKFQQIEDELRGGTRKVEGSFQQFKTDLNEHLQLCKHITTKLETTRAELQSRADKQKLAHQKLIGQAQKLGSNCILETERRLQAVEKAAVRMDNLHYLLTKALVEL